MNNITKPKRTNINFHASLYLNIHYGESKHNLWISLKYFKTEIITLFSFPCFLLDTSDYSILIGIEIEVAELGWLGNGAGIDTYHKKLYKTKWPCALFGQLYDQSN